MKAFGIFLIILVLVAGGALGYLYLTANVTVESISCIATAAQTQTDTFDSLKQQLASSTFTGTLFSQESMIDASSYIFYTYTVKLKNSCFLQAENVELRITPMTGDVLQMSDLERHCIARRSSGQVSGTLLTDADMHNIRELTVTYYFWGLPFTTKVTYNH